MNPSPDVKRNQDDIDCTPTNASNPSNTPFSPHGTVSILSNPIAAKDRNATALNKPKHMTPPPPPPPTPAPTTKHCRIVVATTPSNPSQKIVDDEGFILTSNRSDKRRNDNRMKTPNRGGQHHNNKGSPLSDLTSSPDLSRPRNRSPGQTHKSSFNPADANKFMRHSTPTQPAPTPSSGRVDHPLQHTHQMHINHTPPVNNPSTHTTPSHHPTGLNPVRIGPAGNIEFGTLLYNAPYHNFQTEPTVIWNAHPNVIPNPASSAGSPQMMDISNLPTDFSSSTPLPRSNNGRRRSRSSSRRPRNKSLAPSASDKKVCNNNAALPLPSPSNAPLGTDHGKKKESQKA